MGLGDCGPFGLQVRGLGHQHQIARCDGPAIDRRLHLCCHVGACVDTLDIAHEAIVGIAERLQGKPRDKQDQHRETAKRPSQFGANRLFTE